MDEGAFAAIGVMILAISMNILFHWGLYGKKWARFSFRLPCILGVASIALLVFGENVGLVFPIISFSLLLLAWFVPLFYRAITDQIIEIG